LKGLRGVGHHEDRFLGEPPFEEVVEGFGVVGVFFDKFLVEISKS
jgi:hypothetical protein